MATLYGAMLAVIVVAYYRAGRDGEADRGAGEGSRKANGGSSHLQTAVTAHVKVLP